MLPKEIVLPPSADFHVHLRDGPMMELVTPHTITQGGVDTVYVMPNLQPPITTVSAALSYRSRLQRLAPSVRFLMTLYLHSSITPTTIAEAAAAGILGVKCYPAGVTTNSADGVIDLDSFYPVFAAMQEHDLVLNLHGEVPSSTPSSFSKLSDGADAITVLNAEMKFLPTLHKLHAAFPKLRIVLEHCSTREALASVLSCGPTVAATITAHHLWITIDEWSGDAFSYCKPVAKTPADRVALVQAIVDKSGKFFFGSDSAPHPLSAKKARMGCAAGCFTQGWATQLVVGALEEGIEKGWVREEEVTQEVLEGFLGSYGRRFYKLDGVGEGVGRKKRIVLEKKGERIPESLKDEAAGIELVPFRWKQEVWSLEWKE